VFTAESDLGTGRSPKKTLQIRVSRLRSAINIQNRRTPCAEAKAYVADNRCAVADTKFDRRGILRIRGMHIDKSWLQESITRASRMHGVTIMHKSHRIAVGIATAVGLILLSGLPAQAPAQTAGAPTAAQAKTTGMTCNGNPILDPVNGKPIVDPISGKPIVDPFKGQLAGPHLPEGLLPIDGKVRDSILLSDPPCQEIVNPGGQEEVGLDNLQRGFDFYSWRTFIALNWPAKSTPAKSTNVTSIDQAQADTPTQWEDMDNFKQLLDVMLPANLQPPKWPTDRAGMEAERERLMPEECRALHKQMPERMIVKMIEESFNEPFKTGPLIDQQGHYAIFDILMNRQMFDYILAHHLTTKAGQMSAANSGLFVDFPPGHNNTNLSTLDGTLDGTLGAFMLKVSWKILSPDEIQAKNFHMVQALVLMPPGDPKAKRPCLAETLGLIGFHAVHKTVTRPQWIWTSFEHKKNVPDKNEVAAKKLDGPYNFFSVTCKDDCPAANATPPRPWDPDPALQLKFRKDDSYKSQIVRETPLTDAANNMNTIFHSMLPAASVWQNYMLLSTQWPSAFACTGLHSQSFDAPAPKTDFLKQPDMTCSPAPTFFANSTLETYSQAESDGGVPLATSSCIACHGNAVGFQTRPSNPKPGEINLNQSDFTFMLEKAQ
jgi:hypothetical protein